jgi:hypothetical protein
MQVSACAANGSNAPDDGPRQGIAAEIALVRLAERSRWYKAPSVLEAVLPELGLRLVVSRIGDPLGGVPVTQQNEAPAPQDELALAVSARLMMGAMWPGKMAASGSTAPTRLSERRNWRARTARLVFKL